MKKHRLIKITVRTRETIILPGSSTGEPYNEISSSVCPVCHTPLPAMLPATQSSAVVNGIETPTAELPAKSFGSAETEIKGVL